MVDCDGWACRWSTPRDDGANGAHNMWGSTDGWSCNGEFDLILLFSLASELYGCIPMQICTPHAISVDMYI